MTRDTVAAAAAVGPPRGMQVRLSSNESSYGPSPRVTEILREHAATAHLYPDDQSVALRAAIAAAEGVDASTVAVGNGSSGLIMDLVAHVCRDGGEVLSYGHAFIVYLLAAQVVGAKYIEAPEGAGYARTPEALLEQVTDETRIVLIDNPGNPTGAHLSGDELSSVVERLPDNVTIVVDEAYHHFADGHRGYATVGSLGLAHPRLFVLRTFSKAYGLAGLRLGYLIGPEQTVAAIDAERVRFNVNAMVQEAAVAALDDDDHVRRAVAGIVEGRARMADGLRALEVPFVDGLGNFLLVELGEPAEPVARAYADLGIGVRTLPPYRLDEQIRVTVGRPPEVDAFLEASASVLSAVASRGRPA